MSSEDANTGKDEGKKVKEKDRQDKVKVAKKIAKVSEDDASSVKLVSRGVIVPLYTATQNLLQNCTLPAQSCLLDFVAQQQICMVSNEAVVWLCVQMT